jgi:hypothetical protein
MKGRGRAVPAEGPAPRGTQKAMMGVVGRSSRSRRNVDRVEERTEIANVCQWMADKCGEPPLDDHAR